MLHKGKREIKFFYLIAFIRNNLKPAGDFLRNPLSNFLVYMRKGTHKSTLGISGRTQPLFLLYSVLGINYLVLIISLHPSAETFSFLQAFHQCENTAGNILLLFFRCSILFWKKNINQKDIIFMRGYIKKENQWNCWLNYSFAFPSFFSNIYQRLSNVNNTSEETTLHCSSPSINFWLSVNSL